MGSQIAAAFNSWRWALRVSPPLGLALTLVLFFFTKDPPRGQSDGQVANQYEEGEETARHGCTAFLDDAKEIVKIKSFTWITAGFTAVTFASGECVKMCECVNVCVCVLCWL